MGISSTKKTFSAVGVTILLGVFFGYIGYNDLMLSRQAGALIDSSVVESITDATPDKGARRAQIALNEYNKGITETVRGCNCGVEIDKYTEGNHSQWCTMFASWVSKEAGTPFSDPRTGSWRIVNSRVLAEYLQEHGTWYSRDDIEKNKLRPRLGDFVIYWKGDFEDRRGHVGIVVKVDEGDGIVGIVGGNVRDAVAYQERHYIDDYGFLGFGRPEK